MSLSLRREGVKPLEREGQVEPKDEVSLYRWSTVLAEEVRQGVKGRAIVWRSA